MMDSVVCVEQFGNLSRFKMHFIDEIGRINSTFHFIEGLGKKHIWFVSFV